MTYFRQYPADEDPQALLDPDQQLSTPWGAPDHGPCDKCRAGGRVEYACRSCLEGGADSACPACRGRVRFEDICPTCDGSGEIDRTTRRGVSVLPTLPGLYRYLAEKGFEPEGSIIVELEGALSDDRDLDADCGALLIHPTEVVAVHQLRPALLDQDRR